MILRPAGHIIHWTPSSFDHQVKQPYQLLSEIVPVYTGISISVPAVDLITLGLYQIVQVAQNRLKTLKNDWARKQVGQLIRLWIWSKRNHQDDLNCTIKVSKTVLVYIRIVDLSLYESSKEQNLRRQNTPQEHVKRRKEPFFAGYFVDRKLFSRGIL